MHTPDLTTPSRASSVDERTDGQKRKDVFSSNHSKLNRAKGVDSAKRFAFLLGQTDLFKHFIDLKGTFRTRNTYIVDTNPNQPVKIPRLR